MGKCDCQLRTERVPFIKTRTRARALTHTHHRVGAAAQLAVIYHLMSSQGEFVAGLMPLPLVVNQFHPCGHIFTQATGSNDCYFVGTVGELEENSQAIRHLLHK